MNVTVHIRQYLDGHCTYDVVEQHGDVHNFAALVSRITRERPFEQGYTVEVWQDSDPQP